MPLYPLTLVQRQRHAAPCFPRDISLFTPCYLILKKLSKSLIPLTDCPICAQSPSLFFLENLPVFREKGGWTALLKKGSPEPCCGFQPIGIGRRPR